MNFIADILQCETPSEWLAAALQHQAILLRDHAHCERKAAASAMSLIYRYPQHTDLLQKLSRLVREEMRHFEQVLAIMKRRGHVFTHLSAARYAKGLLAHVRTHEPARLTDQLIIGAFIEARSCERFAAIAPYLDSELAAFYRGLLKSEARHYQDYLLLAQRYGSADWVTRVPFFGAIEAELITAQDSEIRFHSGPLATQSSAMSCTDKTLLAVE